MENTGYINLLKVEYINNKNELNAIAMSKYMKNKFDFCGIKSPLRKEIDKSFFKDYGFPESENIEEIISNLWQQPEREFQYFAIQLLEKEIKIKVDENRINLYKKLIISKSWWDTVDAISSLLVGKFFTYYPDLIENEMQKWNKSENMWLNRSSIIFQLKYKQQTNIELLSKFIKKHLNSKEFFIQKAIGWALREYSKTNPDFVVKFVNDNKLAPLCHKEALKIICKNIN
ncbi:MAG: DNA alkylation repair protein [Bacteroidales bacterium]|nr:DNA alkylation repair protein [Bacteroidales bacterium]MBN2758775.1 DNA alkylation repair protein [Bacteroidales bacterium]